MKTSQILFIAILFLLAACSSNQGNEAGENTDIKAQIDEYKLQVDELNAKIAELEIQYSKENPDIEDKVLVTTMVIETSNFEHFVEVNGIVEAVEMAFISPEMNGQIKKIYVKEGQKVTSGQVLAKLNTEIMDQTILELESSLEFATTLFEKQKKLYDQDIGSEIDFLSAKNNKESLENKIATLKAQRKLSMVYAPFSGIIDEIFVQEGELGMPGMKMMQLINLNKLKVNADVSESYITKIKKGDAVQVSFPSYGIEAMEVPVARVGNVIKPDNRTFNLEINLDNKDGVIKPNSLSTIKIRDFVAKNAVIVPSKLIKRDMQGAYLYTVKKGKAKKVYIEVGLSYEDMSMITNGLAEGEILINDGFNQVSDNVSITTEIK